LVVLAVVAFTPSVLLWNSNQGLIKTATRLQSARLYDTLKNEGADSPKLKSFVALKIIDQLREVDRTHGRVKSYEIERETVQIAGTPSFAAVRCVRERGVSNDTCYVHAIEPKALIWSWSTNAAN